jgi:hypothetical protein
MRAVVGTVAATPAMKAQKPTRDQKSRHAADVER